MTAFGAQSDSPQGEVSETTAPVRMGTRHQSGSGSLSDADSTRCVALKVGATVWVTHMAASTAVSLLTLSSATSNEISMRDEEVLTLSVTARSCCDRLLKFCRHSGACATMLL